MDELVKNLKCSSCLKTGTLVEYESTNNELHLVRKEKKALQVVDWKREKSSSLQALWSVIQYLF